MGVFSSKTIDQANESPMNLTIINSTERDFHLVFEDFLVIGTHIIKSKEQTTYMWTSNAGAPIEANDRFGNSFRVWCAFRFYARIEGRRFIDFEFALDCHTIIIVPTEDGINILPG